MLAGSWTNEQLSQSQCFLYTIILYAHLEIGLLPEYWLQGDYVHTGSFLLDVQKVTIHLTYLFRSHFLIISCVLHNADNGRYEHLFH